MKKTKSRKASLAKSKAKAKLPGKTKAGSRAVATSAAVDEYISRAPEPARAMLEKIREIVRAVVPRDATEVISYRIPAFRHKKVLVWYAAFSNHCSLFPTASIIDQFRDELKGYSTSKGTVHFPTDKPLPSALIRKMVKARVADADSGKR